MKKNNLLMLVLAVLLLTGCGKTDNMISVENNDNSFNSDNTVSDEISDAEAMPIPDEGPAVPVLPDNMMRTSVGSLSISFTVDGNKMYVTGNLGKVNEKFVLLDYAEAEEEKRAVEMPDGAFSIFSEIPDYDGELTVDLYSGEAQYGNFDSVVYDCIKIVKKQDNWVFEPSPVLNDNIAIYTKEKDPADYLRHTEYIQSDNNEIISLSNEITLGCKTDYEKLLKLHDWVAENIYYDFEAFYSGNYQNADSLNVLHSKRAVCEGYANLFAALARVQNIPCRVQSGYALGVGTDKTWSNEALTTSESNHSWNEAYADGRWMIIDSTWDSPNKIENGQMIKGKKINHIYFDSDINFFSLSHRSIE